MIQISRMEQMGVGCCYRLGVKAGHGSVTPGPAWPALISEEVGCSHSIPPPSLLAAPQEVLMATMSPRQQQLLDQIVVGELRRWPAASPGCHC